MTTRESKHTTSHQIRHTGTREGYDLWAPVYDGYDNPLIKIEGPVVDGLLGSCAGLRVADIGCGTGRRALRLAADGAEVTAVDFSAGMLEVLRRQREERQLEAALSVVEQDLGQGTGLPDGSFDRVLCCLVIEHITEIDAMVAELARLCRPGGQVLISDFHPELVRRGYHARFHTSEGSTKHQIAGAYHPVAEYVMAAVRAGLEIAHVAEHLMDEQAARGSRSAQKWVGLPMLLVLSLRKEEPA